MSGGKVKKGASASGFNERLRRGLSGGAVGAANSLLGGGGGMIAVPLLKALGLKERVAHATAIFVILPVSAASFLLYAINGYCDFSVLVPTAIGVALGGAIGAKLLNKLPENAVKKIFAILQAIAGFWLIFR